MEGRNLISGNVGAGVIITGTNTTANMLVGNVIGPGVGGVTLPAGPIQTVGIWLGGGTSHNVIGDVVYQTRWTGGRGAISSARTA
ncbi:MAG: hypothetical protein HZY76_22330 [Anaerolineae bacterium]|nr:MAG: hypothetical protein HZY76_22330 [Anaerolineae bacterium]